jgi:hypothetical protein
MLVTRLVLGLTEFSLSVALSVVVVFLTYRGFILLLAHMRAEEELLKGNAAVAVMIASLMASAGVVMQESIYPVIGILMLSMTGAGASGAEKLTLLACAAGHLVFGFLLSVACVWGALRAFNLLTGHSDADSEIRSGNGAMAAVMAAVMLILSIYMRQGVGAVAKSLIPEPRLGAFAALP